MTTQREEGGGLASAFVRLIGRAAAGLVNSKLARCPRCGRVTKHNIAAETETTGESIYRCEACGLAHSP